MCRRSRSPGRSPTARVVDPSGPGHQVGVAPANNDQGAGPTAGGGHAAGSDRIQLRGLRFLGAHGALPGEERQAQPFEVDLDIYGDLSAAGRSDSLADTVDYGALCEASRAVVEGPHVALLERLAERLAEEVFRVGGPLVLGVEVSIRKLRPPVPFDLASAGVRVYREVPLGPPGGRDVPGGPAVHGPGRGWGPRLGEEPGLRDPGGPAITAITAFVALGSNLGDRWALLRQAVAALPDVVAVSHVYETDPVGGPPGQGPFLNLVVQLRTRLSPSALLGVAHQVEEAAGRERAEHWGPRRLDVDILLYGDETVDTPELQVPHPRMWERGFVVVPLADLAPGLVAGKLRPGMSDGVRLAGDLEGTAAPRGGAQP